ncbi:MAG: hypothetical protein H7Y43_15580 [Akkermansiaceae bacterium]|nr:hypothetical protein [Verrucomicrobiales bacterium]
MQTKISSPLRSRMLAALGIFCSWASMSAAHFAWESFDPPRNLIFQGDATLVQQRIRLAPAQRGKAGGVWLQARQFVQDGFETTFQFQLTERGGHGADGLAFVIQHHDTPRIGDGGRGMGFGGVSNVLAVKFDPYHYKGGKYVKFDEVAVLGGKYLNTARSDPAPLGSVTHVTYTDGKVHTVKIRYAPGTLTVYLDDLNTPLLTVPLNLAELITLDNGRGWVGLTAGTGADYYNHDLLNWSFTSTGSPALASPKAKPQRPLTLTLPTPGETVYAASPTPTLPHDPAFGHALPGELGVSHQIEASGDLVNWTIVTNASLYFRDPDATNYDQRFYRFRVK